MILITGAMGFVGLHVAESLVTNGHQIVLGKFQSTPRSDVIGTHLGTEAFIEHLDLTDQKTLREIGSKHRITGILHLAAHAGSADPVAEIDKLACSLTNLFRAATEWNVGRLVLVSTIGVYGGMHEQRLDESLPLHLHAGHQIPAFKKVSEILGTYFSVRSDVEVVHARLGGIWGPRKKRKNNMPAVLLDAALRNAAPRLEDLLFDTVFAEDGYDSLYVKDAARALGLLQTAETLTYDTYNVGSGRAVANAEYLDAVRRIVPTFEACLEPGRSGDAADPLQYLAVDRLRGDTGFAAEFQVDDAMADYAEWLSQNPY